MTRVLMAEATDFRGPMRVGSHALAGQFVASGASVMWLGTPLYPHTLLRSRSANTAHRIEAWRRGGLTTDGVTEYYPLTLIPVMNRPLLRSQAVAMQTLNATCPPVSAVIERHGFAHPDLLWLSASRFSYPLMRMVGARKRAYRMSDDWSAFPEVPRSLIDLEARILDEVDAVFVTGRVLEARVRARRPDVIYLPNGVDDAFFDVPQREDASVAELPRPRVVFAGTLGDWIDYDAIIATAKRLPGASILLAGAGKPERGRSLPSNVHLLGAIAYERLPALINACEAGIVPFLRTPRTEAASSNKIFQYLACGLPVVASRTTEIEQTGAPIAICDSAEEFAQAVAAALNDPATGKDIRIAFARQNTWAKRAAVVRSVLAL